MRVRGREEKGMWRRIRGRWRSWSSRRGIVREGLEEGRKEESGKRRMWRRIRGRWWPGRGTVREGLEKRGKGECGGG